MKPSDIKLIQTSSAMPEQYDAQYEGKTVGYLRLRWGRFYVTCPDVSGHVVYEAEHGHDMTGSFEDGEREAYLNEARKAIARWHAANEKVSGFKEAINDGFPPLKGKYTRGKK